MVKDNIQRNISIYPGIVCDRIVISHAIRAEHMLRYKWLVSVYFQSFAVLVAGGMPTSILRD